MKISQIFLTIFYCQIITNFAGAQAITYSTVLSHPFQDDVHVHAVVPTNDNGYMLVGQTEEKPGMLIKIDSAGNFLWGKKYLVNHVNVIRDVTLYSITRSKDSCFMLAGVVYNPISAHSNAIYMKVNANGDTLWTKSISDSLYYNISILSIKQTYDDGYCMTGHAESSAHLNVFVAKTDSSGNLEWASTLWNSTYDKGGSIKQTPDSGYLICGSAGSDALMIRLSSNGSVEWAKKYHDINASYSQGNDFEILSDGILQSVNTNNYPVLIKTDSAGNMLWTKTYNQPTSNTSWGYNGPKIHKTSDGAYIFVSGDAFNGGGLTKVDSTGDVIWMKSLQLAPIEAIESNDKGYLVVGFGPLLGIRSRLWMPEIGIIKTDSLGEELDCITPMNQILLNDTFIVSNVTLITSSNTTSNNLYPETTPINLIQRSGCVDFSGAVNEHANEKNPRISPNPSSNKFTLYHEGLKDAQIIVYNNLGRILFEIDAKSLSQEIDLSKMSAGIYYYKIKFTDNKVSAGKLILSN